MSAALWQPQFQPYKDALTDAERLTEADVAAAIEQLDLEIREKLSEGPKPYRYACGVCDAFGKTFYATGDVDMGDPRWIVWIYHEVPKARMKRVDQQHYGPFSNELYERTIATYRAAGWTGEAQEPNA